MSSLDSPPIKQFASRVQTYGLITETATTSVTTSEKLSLTHTHTQRQTNKKPYVVRLIKRLGTKQGRSSTSVQLTINKATKDNLIQLKWKEKKKAFLIVLNIITTRIP